MIKKLSSLSPIFFIVALACILFLILRHSNVTVLNPEGFIAVKERNIIVWVILFMLSLAIPVLVAIFFIAWRYRAENTKAKYAPDWTGNLFLKTLWWAILAFYIAVISNVVWNAAHQLDPYKPITSNVKPLNIQVVALQWKWLFLYPEQNIATVNFLEIPVHTPITFSLTADAPMNSFWIPGLSGQIYAMSTMETKLHIMSDKLGDFPGGAAEINGAGFADMKFITHVIPVDNFTAWVRNVKLSSKKLTIEKYNELEIPSENIQPMSYSSVEKNLYDTIIMKYLIPTGQEHSIIVK